MSISNFQLQLLKKGLLSTANDITKVNRTNVYVQTSSVQIITSSSVYEPGESFQRFLEITDHPCILNRTNPFLDHTF